MPMHLAASRYSDNVDRLHTVFMIGPTLCRRAGCSSCRRRHRDGDGGRRRVNERGHSHRRRGRARDRGRYRSLRRALLQAEHGNPKKGRNARFSARRQGCRSGWHATAPTATTTSSRKPLWARCPSRGRSPPPGRRRVSVWTRAYDNTASRDLVDAYGFEPHIRSRGEEIELKLHVPGWHTRRWLGR